MSENPWIVLVSFAGNTGQGREGDELDEAYRNSPDVKDWRRAGFLPRLVDEDALKQEAQAVRRKRKPRTSKAKSGK